MHFHTGDILAATQQLSLLIVWSLYDSGFDKGEVSAEGIVNLFCSGPANTCPAVQIASSVHLFTDSRATIGWRGRISYNSP